MRLILNIGLAVGSTRSIAAHVALELVKAAGFLVVKHATHASDTEDTLVALVIVDPIAAPNLTRAVHGLAVDLCQDCIAVHCPLTGNGLVGALVGPRPWGAFDPSQFLMLNGRRLQPAEVAA